MVADADNPLVLNILHADSTAYSFNPTTEIKEVTFWKMCLIIWYLSQIKSTYVKFYLSTYHTIMSTNLIQQTYELTTTTKFKPLYNQLFISTLFHTFWCKEYNNYHHRLYHSTPMLSVKAPSWSPVYKPVTMPVSCLLALWDSSAMISLALVYRTH
jgi:hypothetical protein